MDAKAVSGLELSIVQAQGCDFKEALVARVHVMLVAALLETGATGEWRYAITGPSAAMGNPSQYRLEVVPASVMLKNMVHVTVRASLLVGQTVTGMLRLPIGVDRKRFLAEIGPVVNSCNQSRWKGIVEHEERASMMPGTQAGAVHIQGEEDKQYDGDDEPKRAVRPPLIDGQTALARAQAGRVRLGHGWIRPERVDGGQQGHGRVHRPPNLLLTRSRIQPGIGEELSQIGVIPRSLALPFSPSLSVSQRKEGATMPRVSGRAPMLKDEQQLQRFLIRVLQETTEGLIKTRETMPLVREFFPEYKATTGPLFVTLEKHGYVQRVAHGQYRVTAAFVQMHGLAIKLTALPLLAEKHTTARTASRGNGAVPQSAVSAVEDLLNRRQALEEELQHAVLRGQAELEQAIRDVDAELAQVQDRREKRRQALADYRMKYAEILSRTPATLSVDAQAATAGSSDSAVAN